MSGAGEISSRPALGGPATDAGEALLDHHGFRRNEGLYGIFRMVSRTPRPPAPFHPGAGRSRPSTSIRKDPAGLAGDQLGYTVAAAGDLSGDGISEILAGAPFHDGSPGLDTGRAAIFAIEPDCDGDGTAPFGGDCDDLDVDLWDVPGEARSLTLAADRSSMTWDAPMDPGQTSGSLLYDSLRSVDPAGFSNAVCIDSNGEDLASSDTERPGPGGVFYYWVRAQNRCGDGRLGETSEGNARRACACP